MKNTIKKIPVALIGILLAFGVVVDLPMILLHAATQQELRKVESAQPSQSMHIRRVENMFVTPTPEATPSAMPSPTKVIYKPVFVTPTRPQVK